MRTSEIRAFDAKALNDGKSLPDFLLCDGFRLLHQHSRLKVLRGPNEQNRVSGYIIL